MSRRSYDQYCAVARALDAVGERWSLLIVRELLAGPRRYTDLHADLPGVSTDILAARLKQLEGEGLVLRRRLERPANATVYELTERGATLRQVVDALGVWGLGALGEQRPTDAVRAHWVTGTTGGFGTEEPHGAQGPYGAQGSHGAEAGRAVTEAGRGTAADTVAAAG
ncbi:helix-turn-helix transcriptional regulator [Kitasatospora sp. RG8]|uniref:winged helix-turn-helix transcriptional regulator n=1 Tax=Kitasatospora sp. RG8 TaxID=2820815 RepID=UPI001AE0CCE5|nr:helix-turn-helix domain-containing protein [Kitasatospora sp. RG8]MBP0452727.1 helix-turn-helix transcriptional regulator [Kitasatospora sp. RG8]